MKPRHIAHYLLMEVLVIALLFSAWQVAFAQSATSGWFTILWGNNRSGSPVQTYLLTETGGQTTTLLMDEALAAPFGGVIALDRHRITIFGTRRLSATAQATIQVASIAPENPQEKVGEISESSAVSGSQPFLSIMCKFPDIAAEPKSLTYFRNMYSNVHPGLDNYWREVSYLTANIDGSDALGWYTLPHPRSYYLYDGFMDLTYLAQDCTATVDAIVNFASFKGINLMFNSDLDGFAWGGGQYMKLDGVSKVWPMTWEPPWGYSDIATIAHEMGHAFGLPHSSGKYGETYDNEWDVMSDTWSNCDRATDPTYGCLAQSTISYHKDKLGWIPTARKYTANSTAVITLEQLELPQTGNYLMAQIPIGGSTTHFYTVEVRRQSGYDMKLPGQAVIIHEVDTTREIPAQVIDADGNGATGDGGGKWMVGETFSDKVNAIAISIVSATVTGFQVYIQNGIVQTNSVFKSLGANDGWVLESGENSREGGALNNTATTFNLGDDSANKQYRAILHFDTSSLPDTAVITNVTLKIMKQGLVGENPFGAYGALQVAIREPYFGAAALQVEDFQATPSNTAAAVFGATATSSWYGAVLSSTARTFVNLAGATQFRLSFTLDDNNDRSADYMSFYSGNAATDNRPKLIVQYYLP